MRSHNSFGSWRSAKSSVVNSTASGSETHKDLSVGPHSAMAAAPRFPTPRLLCVACVPSDPPSLLLPPDCLPLGLPLGFCGLASTPYALTPLRIFRQSIAAVTPCPRRYDERTLSTRAVASAMRGALAIRRAVSSCFLALPRASVPSLVTLLVSLVACCSPAASSTPFETPSSMPSGTADTRTSPAERWTPIARPLTPVMLRHGAASCAGSGTTTHSIRPRKRGEWRDAESDCEVEVVRKRGRWRSRTPEMTSTVTTRGSATWTAPSTRTLVTPWAACSC
mmetsp:Transcript_4878/g.11704  ORF Transcript_4878/g.11704 Transcript_4878/m.11704 type:complete len:280 (-) Transcript_4878:871-1710(-)